VILKLCRSSNLFALSGTLFASYPELCREERRRIVAKEKGALRVRHLVKLKFLTLFKRLSIRRMENGQETKKNAAKRTENRATEEETRQVGL